MAALPVEVLERSQEREGLRYLLRSAQWFSSSLKRVRGCGRTMIGDGSGAPVTGVPVVVNPGVSAHFTALMSCGSIWSCPVCSAKIRNRRSVEIQAAATQHVEAGKAAYMVTLTVPHDLGDDLDHLRSVVTEGWTALWSGRNGQTRREWWNVLGSIKVLEVTHGDHGWHPHLHVLVLCEDGWERSRQALWSDLADSWSGWATRHGLRRPHDVHGFHVSPIWSAEGVGAYVAKVQEGASLGDDRSPGGGKVGNELARLDWKTGRKGSRTPFEILRDAVETGDKADFARWWHYEQVMRGKHAITWSDGLKACFDLEEVTDQEILEEDQGGEPICVIPAETWEAVTSCRVFGLDLMIRKAALALGVAGVAAVLSEHGFDPGLYPPEPRPR